MELQLGRGLVMVATRRAIVGIAVSALLGVSVWVAAPASAFFFVGGGPAIPDGFVGQTVPASIGLSNNSTQPENFAVVVTAIDLYPACSNGAADCVGGVIEPDVYKLKDTPVGGSTPAGNASCEGSWGVTEAQPGRWRFVPPGGEGTLTIQPTETCVVNFPVLVLRVPTVDASPPQAGTQTAPVLRATFTQVGTPGPATVRNGGNTTSTVLRASPPITTSATPVATIGAPIQDVATVEGAPAPAAQLTGTVSFTAYGPDNPTCAGAPAFSSGPRALAGGQSPVATSGGFTATSPGTYRWVAAYSGDVNYLGVTSACNAPNESSVVTTSLATITTSATPSVTIGGSINDVATVAGPRRPRRRRPAPSPSGSSARTIPRARASRSSRVSYRWPAGHLPLPPRAPSPRRLPARTCGSPPTAATSPMVQ